MSLPSSDLANLGQILADTKTRNGNTTIVLSQTDSITLTGVTKAELKANPQDFKLHG